MRIETVTLGEREYKLTELPLRRARAFRETLKAKFGWVIDLIEQSPTLDISNSTTVMMLMRTAGARLVESVDDIVDLLYLYSPAIKADQEYIEENATEAQALDAFVCIMELIVPFFGMKQTPKLTRAVQQIGSVIKQTETSLPSTNGASGLTNSTGSTSTPLPVAISGASNGKHD